MAAASQSKPAPETAIEIDPWTDTLGRLLERWPRLWIRLGNLETRLLAERLDEIEIRQPIYIAGLARSGSTILLELLARHPEVATHRYRDFPLVLTPWAWNWFVDRAGTKKRPAKERAHQDRLLVSPESPEAFEEALWMAFFPDLHEPAAGVVFDGHASHAAFEAFYRDHVRKLLALRQGRRYVAKGNYNITRIGYLKKIFPDARFLVPVRDPVWHVASLMKQHRLFVAAEKADPRVLRHLQRSGHFEFGQGRRAIEADDPDAAAEVTRLWQAGEEVAGWAAHWALVYGHLADRLADPAIKAATHIVRYEDLCADPAKTLTAVCDHCALGAGELPALARAMVSAPAYYRPAFSESELETIQARTATVASRFGYR